eukprot:9489573-Pyramimonas_sp.AAC.1
MGRPWVKFYPMFNRVKFLYFEESVKEEMERCWHIFTDMQKSEDPGNDEQTTGTLTQVKREPTSDAEGMPEAK